MTICLVGVCWTDKSERLLVFFSCLAGSELSQQAQLAEWRWAEHCQSVKSWNLATGIGFSIQYSSPSFGPYFCEPSLTAIQYLLCEVDLQDANNKRSILRTWDYSFGTVIRSNIHPPEQKMLLRCSSPEQNLGKRVERRRNTNGHVLHELGKTEQADADLRMDSSIHCIWTGATLISTKWWTTPILS